MLIVSLTFYSHDYILYLRVFLTVSYFIFLSNFILQLTVIISLTVFSILYLTVYSLTSNLPNVPYQLELRKKDQEIENIAKNKRVIAQKISKEKRQLPLSFMR